MPFINDKLKSYQTTIDKEEANDKLLLNRSRFKFEPDAIIEQLSQTIFGQEEMIEKISDMLRVVHADILEASRPLYIGMFLGPTGVGKTETVRILAEAIYGDKESFSRIDMNTLAQEHYAAAITGAPPGYVGSKEGTTIFDEKKIEGSFSKPGIVLLDEIEKADSSVIQSLLNVFDNGKMVLTNGERVIDFRNSMIFMTSNLGSRQIFEFAENDFKSKYKRFLYRLMPNHWGKNDKELLQKIVKQQLEDTFTPEFLNRIDDTIVFNWLGEPALEPIVDKLITELNGRLKKHHCQIELEASAKSFLINKGYDKHYGARAMKRAVRKYIEVPLAKILQEQNSLETITVTMTNSDLEFNKDITMQRGGMYV